MISVSSFSILGVFVIITIGANILWCYLKRPEKTPIALVSVHTKKKTRLELERENKTEPTETQVRSEPDSLHCL